jgi:DNA-binding transcriptional regulator YdaS (Cro superfamily)
MNTEAIKTACETVGGITAMANHLGITVGAVHQWTKGTRRVPAERCLAIEELTKGAVKVEHLRPDVPWHAIRNSRAA